MRKKYDVIVAGGGPSGLSAAMKAASAGCRVLVMEMQAQIGAQGRSAWIGGNVWRIVPASVLSRVREVRLSSSRESLSVRGEFGVILDRRIFDRGLALKAAESGAEIWLSAPVRDLLIENGRVAGVRSWMGSWHEEVEADVVVDATGSKGEWSGLFMKSVTGREWNRENLVFSSEYHVANFEGGGVNLVFNPYLTPGGHGWVYSCGSGIAAVGVHGVRINPEIAIDEFIGRDSVKGLRASVPIASFRSQFSLSGPPERTHAAGIMAVGGAACQIYQLAPRGLAHAIRAGEIAGEVATEAVSSGNFSEEALSEYDEKWREEFYSDLAIGRILRSSLSASQGRKINQMLSRAKEAARLRRAVVDLFLCRNLKRSVRALLDDGTVSGIIGGEPLERLLG